MTDTTKTSLLSALERTDADSRLTRGRAKSICGTDRNARRIINELRKEGYVICSDSHAPGYYMAHTPEEKAPFIADIRSRIKELSEILEKMGGSAHVHTEKQQPSSRR